MTDTRLALHGVSAGYGGSPVLSDFSLELHAGEIVALVGPNGAGKSTALRVASGLLRPTTGRVEVEGRDVAAWKRHDLARRLAVVLQVQVTPPLVRVRDYVALGRSPYARFLGNETSHDWRVVDEALATAGVSELAGRPLEALSGGERQRVILARALAQEPSVLLLDEPTSNLDLKYQEIVLSLARKLAAERGLACLIVLHDITLAAQFADRVCLLQSGRQVAIGTPTDVLGADRLSAVYDTPLTVLEHPASGRPIVVHAGREAP